MKLKLKTILLVVIALLSVGGIYFWDKNRTPATDSKLDKPTGTALFTIKETDIDRIEIQAQNGNVTLARQPKGWQILTPKPGPADEATVAFLLNLLATGRSERALSAESGQLQQFGLDKPTTTVTLQLKDNKTHQLRLGTQNFDQSSIYASVDAPASSEKVSVALLPTSFLNATNRPLADWQAKPKGAALSPANPNPYPSSSLPSTPTTDSLPSDPPPLPSQP
jgi:Domain of unknown function (DUF4340)